MTIISINDDIRSRLCKSLRLDLRDLAPLKSDQGPQCTFIIFNLVKQTNACGTILLIDKLDSFLDQFSESLGADELSETYLLVDLEIECPFFVIFCQHLDQVVFADIMDQGCQLQLVNLHKADQSDCLRAIVEKTALIES